MKLYRAKVAKLTGISIRTLQHYDAIGLLKPSRLYNKYRIYSKNDLEKLQSILALKAFGFELNDIKAILSEKLDISEFLQAQRRCLEEKISNLQEASEILSSVIEESKLARSLNTTSILKLIGVYKMTKELEKSWAGKIFTKEQIEKFTTVPMFNKEQSEQHTKDWQYLISDTQSHINEDPSSDIGVEYAVKWMNLARACWKDEDLLTAVWEARKSGKITEHDSSDQYPVLPISASVMEWVDRAIKNAMEKELI